MRNISPEGEICCFLCSACNITHVVSTVNRRVLIFCKEFVTPRKFLNDFLKEWVVRMDELKSDEITKDKYFEWKITQPQTCDGCEKYEPRKNGAL